MPTSCKETVRGTDFVITYVGDAETDSWLLQRNLIAPSAGTHLLEPITVQPGGTVTGRVTGAANQAIRVLRTDGSVAFTIDADAQGRYTFHSLVPGTYSVAVGGAGTLPWRSDQVLVTRGGTAVVNGALDRGAVLTGTLTDHGRPVPGTDVLVRRGRHTLVAAATTDRRGRFSVAGLRPGHYTVGILYDGSPYLRTAVGVDVAGGHARHEVAVAVRRGASVTVHPSGATTGDELRDSRGRPVQLFHDDGSGSITYQGLRPGRYAVVVAGRHGFGVRRVHVRGTRALDLGRLALDRKLLTLTGSTAPHAVVEATTGNQCPPDAAVRLGAFHEIARADARGHYTVRRLVPGRYMIGADAYPGTEAPRCRSNVTLRHGRVISLPLEAGASVTGRLVNVNTGAPVVTTLSYELAYPAGLTTNPTSEHPARARTIDDTGVFSIRGLSAGTVTGGLAERAGEGINDVEFQVVFPYQDGTPYVLSTEPMPITLIGGTRTELGDIPVSVH